MIQLQAADKAFEKFIRKEIKKISQSPSNR